MLTLSVTALTSVIIALANSAVAAPVQSHPTLAKRGSGVTIGHNSLCLGVESLANGARLSTKECDLFNPSSNPPFYNRWDIALGDNNGVRLSGLPTGSGDFCLDSGDLRGSYDQDLAKIWTCSSNENQQFYYTPDKHIAVTGGTDCLESGRYGVIYTQCSSSIASGIQTWDVSGLVIADPTRVTAAPPTQTTPPTLPPGPQGKPIKWLLNGQEKCLTVAGGALSDGAALKIGDCFPSTSAFYYLQQFVYTQGATKIRVAPNGISKTDFCVDFGSDRGVNAVGGKVWQCYEGLPAQALWITGDNHIAVEGDNQCLDVKAESQASKGTFYDSLKDVQSWQCVGGNDNQIFGF